MKKTFIIAMMAILAIGAQAQEKKTENKANRYSPLSRRILLHLSRTRTVRVRAGTILLFRTLRQKF